jgi:hypothetical protein
MHNVARLGTLTVIRIRDVGVMVMLH